MNICEQAETLRLLLPMGVVAKAEAIAWAHELIRKLEYCPE